MTGRLLQTTYELVTYPSFAHPQSHPDRLATVAKLFGMDPASVENCRVLELGCASGGNLIPMAACLPASQFVGIDFSPRQVASGQEMVLALGLHNIRLEQRDIGEIPSDFGVFDYVIAHGVYSWVSPEVQSKILAVCKQCLGPDGVAFVSYGTYPGCHSRRAVREMIRYHTARISDPQERATQARALVSFLDDTNRSANHGYSAMLREACQRFQDKSDAYLLHDDLEEEYHPVYFSEFMDRANRAGLQFLEEADITSSLFPRFPPEVLQTITQTSDDQVRREQYVDFLTNRVFRETLLCHDHVSIRRAIGPDDLRPFLFASQAEYNAAQPVVHSTATNRPPEVPSRPAPLPETRRGEMAFRTEPEQSGMPHENAFSASHPLSKSALQYLARNWPRVVSLEELLTSASGALDAHGETVHAGDHRQLDVQVLLETLWQAFAANLVELHVHAPALATEPSDRPVASPFARHQATMGTRVTNLRHETIQLDDLGRWLLLQLDGARDRAALVKQLTQYVADHGAVVQQYGKRVTDPHQLECVLGMGLETKLQLLARWALLIKCV